VIEVPSTPGRAAAPEVFAPVAPILPEALVVAVTPDNVTAPPIPPTFENRLLAVPVTPPAPPAAEIDDPVHVIDEVPPLVAATAEESSHKLTPNGEPLLPPPPEPTLIVNVSPHAMLNPEL
jgi:hypothetical protein